MTKLNHLLGLFCISSLFSNTLGGLIKNEEIFDDKYITDDYITDEIPTEYVTSIDNYEIVDMEKTNEVCNKIHDIMNQYADIGLIIDCEVKDEGISL